MLEEIFGCLIEERKSLWLKTQTAVRAISKRPQAYVCEREKNMQSTFIWVVRTNVNKELVMVDERHKWLQSNP